MWLVNKHQFANKKLITWVSITTLLLSSHHRCHVKWQTILIWLVCSWKIRLSTTWMNTCVVDLKRYWPCLRKSKFNQKTSKTNYLRTSSKHGTLLIFSRRFRVSYLLFTCVWYQTRAKKHAQITDRSLNFRTPSSISIK